MSHTTYRTCQTCKHFREHYVKVGDHYRLIDDGHCVFPRCKMRRNYTPACPHYAEREIVEQENAPITELVIGAYFPVLQHC